MRIASIIRNPFRNFCTKWSVCAGVAGGTFAFVGTVFTADFVYRQTQCPTIEAFTLQSNLLVKQIPAKDEYQEKKRFNDYVTKYAHLVTKDFLLQFGQYIYDVDKFFNLNPNWALDVGFIVALLESDKLNSTHRTSFWKSINEAYESIGDPSSRGLCSSLQDSYYLTLLYLQIRDLKQRNVWMGVLCCIPYKTKDRLICDDDFISEYHESFNSNDWRSIVSRRKTDEPFLSKYEKFVDHNYHFLVNEKYDLEQVQNILLKGKLKDLQHDSWDKILETAKNGGKLNELYLLCGGSIIFPVHAYYGSLLNTNSVQVYVSIVPNIDSVSDEALRSILGTQKLGWISSYTGVETIAQATSALGVIYVDENTTNYVKNLESSFAVLLLSFAMNLNVYHSSNIVSNVGILRRLSKLRSEVTQTREVSKFGFETNETKTSNNKN